MARGTLRDRYRQRGYWAAAFAPATATLDAGCGGGVTVTLKVTEGVQYIWDKAIWSGNSALSADELSPLIGLKPGDTAAMRTLDDGLRAIARAYGKQGYIAHRADYAPRLDESSRTAVFEIRVTEGPQFHFGNVEFVGFTDSDAATLRKRWQLAAGSVFDDSYPAAFLVEVLRLALQALAGGRQVANELIIDDLKRVVDVRYTLK